MPDPETLPLPVAVLLQQSRQANLDRLRAGNAKPPNYQLAEQHAARALELRLQAHDIDPQHADSEWANDKAPHDQVVGFLRKYPSIS